MDAITFTSINLHTRIHITAFLTHHNVLWIKIVTEGSIIKINLIESLLCQLDHLTLVIAPILVLANHALARYNVLARVFALKLHKVLSQSHRNDLKPIIPKKPKTLTPSEDRSNTGVQVMR